MSQTAMARPVEILLVEDNPGDARLTREAFKEACVASHLSVVGDGVDALAFLRRQGKFAAAARPDMILLDLNLPKKSGLEVLADVKIDAELRRTPVVILSTSQAEQDITRSYDLYANCYITKPVNLEEFIAVVKSIEEFWLATVQLPCEGRPRDC
jgi:two-component system, chemotaxis family, response regulator Rcp1